MTSNRRITIPALAAALAAASLALPGAALARGGGGGGGGGATTTAPAPAPTPVPECDFSLDGTQADGSTLFTNPVSDAGCLTVRASGSQLRVYSVVVWPGWTYVITSNGEGTNSRVAVTFTQTATGVTHEARIELGKTVIK
jgi:hypothetical protein